MIFKNSRCMEKELLDDFSLSGRDLEKNLYNLGLVNRFLGGNRIITKALSHTIRQQPDLGQKKLHIADIGCGGGDILRTVAQWADKKSLKCRLTGIDANPASIHFAEQKSRQYPNIDYQVLNVFSAEFQQQQFDIILLSTICHHLSDQELIRLFMQLKNQARVAIIISDLHRHWFAYYATRILTRIIDSSFLEKHDGPLSVRKAFKFHELKSLLRESKVTNHQIKWRWAFRWLVYIAIAP
jgi:2-polyprenyl-3-methyl-5-hydroxy-6-metoxy-1,4-benzoquinol methylase